MVLEVRGTNGQPKEVSEQTGLPVQMAGNVNNISVADDEVTEYYYLDKLDIVNRRIDYTLTYKLSDPTIKIKETYLYSGSPGDYVLEKTSRSLV